MMLWVWVPPLIAQGPTCPMIACMCGSALVLLKEPIKDTQTLKSPIRGSHLGERLRQSESGTTDMNPVVTELDFIEQGGPRDISGGTHTQSIIQGGENVVHSDVITHMLTNPDQVSLESDSFLFDPLQAKTLMVISLAESSIALKRDRKSVVR